MIYGKSGAIAGAIALAVAWPFATGQIGQGMYERELQEAQAPYLSFENVSYQRGYLSSEVLTRVSLKGAIKKEYEQNGFPTSILVLSALRHGFLGITGTSEIEMTPELTQWGQILWPSISNSAPVLIKTDFSVFGGLKFDVTVAPIDSQQKNIKITSSPLIFQGTVAKNNEMMFNVNIPMINFIDNQGGSIFLKDFSGQGKGEMLDHFWLGSQHVSIATLGFDDAKETKVTMSDFTVDITNALKDENNNTVNAINSSVLRLDNTSEFSFRQLRVSKAFVLDNFTVRSRFFEIDYAALNALIQTSSTFSSPASMQDVSSLLTAFEELVNKGFNVEIDPFEVDTPKGKVNAKLDLRVNPGVSSISQDLTLLTSRINAELSLNMPSAYTAKLPLLSFFLDKLAVYGFVSEAENEVTLSMKIEGDNAMSPSGKKVPLTMLIQTLK